jgi:hypothetical protein
MTIIGGYDSSSGYTKEESAKFNKENAAIISNQQTQPTASSSDENDLYAKGLKFLASQGGGTAVTANSIMKVNPSQEFYQAEAKKEIEKKAGESITKIETITSPTGKVQEEYFRGTSGKVYHYAYTSGELSSIGNEPQRVSVMANNIPITFSPAATEKVGGAEGLRRIMELHQLELLKPQFQAMGKAMGEYYGTVGGKMAQAVAVNAVVAPVLGGLGAAVWSVDVPILSYAFSVGGVFTSTFGMSYEAAQHTLTKEKFMLYSIGMVGSSLGVYSSLSQIAQKNLVDPVLKDVNIKTYQEITIEKTQYVPKYGVELNRVVSEGDVFKTTYFERGDIYGKPQSVPPELKPYDLGMEVRLRADVGGIAKVETFTFKLTDKGLQPLGEIDIQRFFPSAKNNFAYMMEQSPKDLNFDFGITERLNIPASKPSINIFPSDEFLRNIISIKIIGLEKPETFKPFTIYKPMDIEERLKFMSGDAVGIGDIAAFKKDVFGYLGIRDLTHTVAEINLKTLTIETQATRLAEQSIATGFVTIKTFSQPVFVDYARTPEGINTIITPIILNLERVNVMEMQRIDLGIKSDLRIKEMVSPVEVERVITNIKLGTDLGTLTGEQVRPVSITAVNQTQIIGTKLREMEFSMQNTAVTQIYLPREVPHPNIVKIIEPETYFKLNTDSLKPRNIVIVTGEGFKEPKFLKVRSFMQPTASLYSLERAAAVYGKGSLARGKGIERVFRNLARSSGLSLEFPAAEFIKGVRL